MGGKCIRENLDKVSNVHGHLLNLSVVELFNVLKEATNVNILRSNGRITSILKKNLLSSCGHLRW